MHIKNWCEIAQDEQFNKDLHNIYANFRYSVHHDLVTDRGKKSFISCLSYINTSDVNTSGGVSYGAANQIIDKAIDIQFQSTLPVLFDFRIDGKQIAKAEIPDPGYLVSVSPSSPHKVAASAGAALPPASASTIPVSMNEPQRLVWMTPAANLVNFIQDATRRIGTKLSPRLFFGELNARLGLHYGAEPVRLELAVYALKNDDKLRRPHVFSRGYPDRFCASTIAPPFGQTADYRTGEYALPEAVALLPDLSRCDPVSLEHGDLRGRLAPFVDFIDPLDARPIAANLGPSDFIAPGDRFTLNQLIRSKLKDATGDRPCSRAYGGSCPCR